MGEETKEVWIKGKQGGIACLTITEWPDGLVHVCGEEDHVTRPMVRKWARKNYKDATIYDAYFGDGCVGIQLRKGKD